MPVGVQAPPAQIGEGLTGSVREDYGIQKTGFWLAVVTLAALGLVTVILLRSLPSATQMPQLAPSTSKDQVDLLERWMKIQADYQKSVVDRTVQLGQLFVTGTLLPVLTALLGYMFGKREDADAE